MNRQRVVLSILAFAMLSGCTTNDTGENQPAPSTHLGSWTMVAPNQSLILDSAFLSGSDWVVIEFKADEPEIVTFRKDILFDFENPALSPDLTSACPILSAGSSSQNASFIVNPFWVPERSDPSALELGPQPEVSAGKNGTVVDERLRTTGFQLGDHGLFQALMGSSKGPLYLAFGLADLQQWIAAGASYQVEVESRIAYEYRVVHRGGSTCIVDFADYPTGTYARTSQLSYAEELGTMFEVNDGLVTIVAVGSDLDRSIELTDPHGDIVLQDAASSMTPAASAQGYVYCGNQSGDWNLSFPSLRGTDHRAVYANTLLLDVPARYHDAFPCFIQDRPED